MKFFKLFFVLVFFSISAYSQDIKGYYISNSGQRTDGYFEEGDMNDITKINFRTSPSAGYAKLSFDAVKEYGTENSKFIKETVQVDETGGSTADVSGNREPSYVKKTVFLEVLVEGNASAYQYNENGNSRFYYSISDKGGQITPLVFRKYKYSGTEVAQNVYFRQQLTVDALCPDDTNKKYVNLLYNATAITKAIEDYNSCTGKENVFVKKKPASESSVSVGVYAGASFVNSKVDVTGVDVKGNSFGFLAGGEASLGFKYKPYSFFGRLGVEQFSGDGTHTFKPAPNSVHVFTDRFDMDCVALNVGLGSRYAFDVTDNNKIFAEASVNILLPLSGSIKYFPNSDSAVEFNLQSSFYFNLGVGYAFSKDLSITASYSTNRNLLANVPGYKFNNSGFNITARYNLL